MTHSKQVYWDPLGNKGSDFSDYIQAQHASYGKIESEIFTLKRGLSPWKTMTIIFLACIILSVLLYPHFKENILVFIVPVIGYWRYIENIAKRGALLLLAEKTGWIYLPDSYENGSEQLAARFPEMVSPRSAGLSHEILGSIEIDNKIQPFWMAVYQYIIEKNDRSKVTIFAVKLNRRLTRDLIVRRKRGFSFGLPVDSSEIEKSDITTESVEFDKQFTVLALDDKADNELYLRKMLSPAVLVQLLELNTAWEFDSILFRDDIMIVRLPYVLKLTKYTNFWKRVEIDKRDVGEATAIISSVAKVAGTMISYID